MKTDTQIHHGFTLLELLASIIVMSIISVTLMPVIGAASESFAVARQVRSSTERAGFALDRVTRVIRQAPIGADNTGVGVSSATASSLTFSDGTGFQLIGSTLEMLVVGNDPVPLCLDVDEFQVLYIGDDGVTNTVNTPTITHRFMVRVETDGIELTTVVHPRVWIGQESS